MIWNGRPSLQQLDPTGTRTAWADLDLNASLGAFHEPSEAVRGQAAIVVVDVDSAVVWHDEAMATALGTVDEFHGTGSPL